MFKTTHWSIKPSWGETEAKEVIHMENFSQFLFRHYCSRKNDHLRLGQRFVTEFIRKPWPELFYQTNDQKAVQMIEQYLIDHQYLPDMPPRANR